MAFYKSNLWKRGVPDENVISLPCRVAYQMLENSTNLTARKQSSGDTALEIIATSLESADCLLNTVSSALLDLMHSFEHMAPIAAELCSMKKDDSCNSRLTQLAIELLKDVGRLDGNASSGSNTSGKASGIKNVAPFLSELADKMPDLVLGHISLVLHHLKSEPYNMRSAIVIAIGHLLIKSKNVSDGIDESFVHDHMQNRSNEQVSKRSCVLKENLYIILLEHVYDVSSYTRATVLKTWSELIEAQSVPTNKLLLITKLAIDRLQDKTVIVRRSAMQVSTFITVAYLKMKQSSKLVIHHIHFSCRC
jgi:condensin complex subunit 1